MASSPPTSPQSPSSASDRALTPSRKVQALLAQFSDSETDSGDGGKAKVSREQPRATSLPASSRSANLESDSEDDLPVARKSKMASRLSGGRGIRNASESEPEQQEGGSVQENSTVRQDAMEIQEPTQDSEDELSRPAPKRRLLTKRKSSPAPSPAPSEARLISTPPSPLFFPSPSALRRATSSPPRRSDEDEARAENNSTNAKSRFLALVQRNREARLRQEAAEIVKRATQSKSSKKQSHKTTDEKRGTSPVSGADEDSDVSNAAAAEKFTQDARPTRKASKKAVEEMKRETQRMSRNMQLSHQARTKKKITKESLLARFNYTLPGAEPTTMKGTSSTDPSSEIESDALGGQGHDTPPTSPMQEHISDDFTKQTEDITMTDVPTIPDSLVLEAPPLESIDIQTAPSPGKGKAKMGALVPQQRDVAVRVASMPPVSSAVGRVVSEKPSARARLAEILKSRAASNEPEQDDLDIVTMKGDTRKYAAFEHLTKRKAKETGSHLALRNLAQRHATGRSNRSKMTASEMEATLKKSARDQARQERQSRIDELKAKGVVIQTAQEREADQQEVEDLVARARQEAAEIQKREKEAAKKDGTYVKDGMDDDDDSDEEDGDFEEDLDDATGSDDDDDEDAEGNDGDEALTDGVDKLVDDAADEADSDEAEDRDSDEELESDHLEDIEPLAELQRTPALRKSRNIRVVSDDEDTEYEPKIADSPALPQPLKTPQSILQSARKQIPGLQMSNDLPMGLSQAFAATMADSQTQEEVHAQDQDSLDVLGDLPSPNIALAPRLNRMESIDIISDSQPASQTQPLNISLSFSQSQQFPESPLISRGIPQTQPTPSQAPFEPTQDEGYLFSPFHGSRFNETPQHRVPHSTVDTVIVPADAADSPIVQRKGRLQRGRVVEMQSDDEAHDSTAFDVMRKAAKKDDPTFDKTKSHAREIVDEAAEESDDEYAGLGGASDDDGNDMENDDDRALIDHDTQVGRGDEARLAGLFADRERKDDEAAVSKLMKDITTGGLRRKRGANDDLDLSDEEDATARRREAKRREFAKMRRELLKDEAVGKIAEDRKKEAFLKSIEDREERSEDEDGFDQPETATEDSQSQQPQKEATDVVDDKAGNSHKEPLSTTSDSQLNRRPTNSRRGIDRKPTTRAEISESVSFLIEEPDSQSQVVDLGLANSDSDSDTEAYVDLHRHLKSAQADENAAADAEEFEDLDDFIEDDDGLAKPATQDDTVFKKPTLPSQTSDRFASRRTNRPNVVNRLALMRQSSSASSSTSVNAKMAFYATTNSSNLNSFKTPNLLRRATTNSSLSSMSSENLSATGVSTRTERGHVSEEKEFVRKAKGGVRNSVNWKPSVAVREEREKRVTKKLQGKRKGKSGGGFVAGLLRGDTWG